MIGLTAALICAAPVEAVDLTGSVPVGPVVSMHGAIYGATEYGGPNCPRHTNEDIAGCGTVYKIDPNGKHIMLHSFAGPDGSKPSSGVVADADGTLYGTTDAGGDHGHGVIFRIAPDGSGFSVLYSFATGTEHGALTIGSDGTLYGVAPSPHGDGHGATVFALSKESDYRTLRVFGSETHIAAPLAIDSAGQLYGILIRGGFCGGDVFSLSRTSAYGILFTNTVPYTDARCATTVIPTSPLVYDAGAFYATDRSTLYRVDNDGLKALYTLSPTETTLSGPMGQLQRTFVDGTLIASTDGSLVAAVTPSLKPRDCGRIIRFDPAGDVASTELLKGEIGCVQPTVGRNATPDALTYVGNALHGVVDQGVWCSHLPKFCGAVLSLEDGQPRVVAAFDPPDPPEALLFEYASGAGAQMSAARLPGHLSISIHVFSPSQGPFYVRTRTSAIALRPAGSPHASPIPLSLEQDDLKVDSFFRGSNWWTGDISLRAPVLPAGLYDVDTSHFRPVISDADGYPIPAGDISVLPVYVPPAPSLTPVLMPGQRFIDFTEPTGRQPYSTPSLRIRTLQSVDHIAAGGARLTFGMDDGSTVSADTQIADIFDLDGLLPIVSDAEVDVLASKYAGRDVYPIADFTPVCLSTNGMSMGMASEPAAPLHIKSIVRLYGTSAMWGIGPWILHTLDSGADYVTSSPILVAFDGRREDGLLVGPPYAGHACKVAYAEFSGVWDFERSLSLRSIIGSHPAWSQTTLGAIEKHQVVVGMTRDMVIASVGYPSVYGTAAQMMKLDTWNYEMPAPFAYTVHFKGDTVVKYDPPGQLP